MSNKHSQCSWSNNANPKFVNSHVDKFVIFDFKK